MKRRERKDMGLSERLAEQAGVQLHRRPGVDLIAVADAHEFLDVCAGRGVRVLGVDGFYLRGDEVHVDMTRVGDFSSVVDVDLSIAESRSFVDAVAVPELMLDFVLDG